MSVNTGQRYLICTVPRSGSTYLSYLLGRTERLGMKRIDGGGWEQLSRLVESGFRNVDWSGENALTLFSSAFERSASPSGQMGFKVTWDQFQRVLEQGAAKGTPPLTIGEVERILAETTRLIWLRRHDRLRQAVSLTKALQSGAWNSTYAAQVRHDYVYSYLLIWLRLRRVRLYEEAWEAYFHRVGVEPLTLYYEDYVRDPAEAIRAVGREVGVDLAVPDDLDDGLLKRQSDHVNEEWQRRYQADSSGVLSRSLAMVRSCLSLSTWSCLLASTGIVPRRESGRVPGPTSPPRS